MNRTLRKNAGALQDRETDPLHARRALESGGAAYNMALMSMEEWLESPLYTSVSILHDFRHVIEVPIRCGETVVGTINFATSDPDRGYTAGEVRLAEALGRLVGVAIEDIGAREDLAQELDRARLAGPLVALTPREREVTAFVVDGLADREIAQRLCLSRHTVSQYVKRIHRKLGVDSRVALTRLSLLQKGLVPLAVRQVVTISGRSRATLGSARSKWG